MKTMYKKHMRSFIALPIAILFGIASGCNGSREANHFFNPFKSKKNNDGFERGGGFQYKDMTSPPKPLRSYILSDPKEHSIVMETRATIPATIKGIWVLGEDADCTSCLLVVERQQGASITSKANHPDNRVGFLFSIPKQKFIPAFWTIVDQTIRVAEQFYNGASPCKSVRVTPHKTDTSEVTGSLVDSLISQAKKLDYRELTSGAQQLTGWTHFDTSTKIEAFERTHTACGRGAELNGVLGNNALKEGDRLSLVFAKDRDPFAFVQGVRKGFFQSTKCVTHVQGHIVCPVSNEKKIGSFYGTVDKKALDGVFVKDYPVTYGCVQQDTYRVTPKGIRKITHVSLFELKPTAKKRKLVTHSASFSNLSASKPPVEPEHIYDIPYHYRTV